MNKEPSDSKYGVKFSEIHAIDLADMDGDGTPDIVTANKKGTFVHFQTKKKT